MSGQGRPLDADGWREVLGRFDAAALTVVEFSAWVGMSTSSFCCWRERLVRGGKAVAGSRP